MVIPEGVDSLGEWVPSLDKQAPGMSGVFLHPENIRQIILPEGLQTIGLMAFRGCVNLEELVFPTSLYWIAADFEDCKSLRSVEFKSPNCLPLGDNMIAGLFKGCVSLERVRLPEGNSDFHWIAPSMFEGCTGLREITIPWGVYGIEKDAFKNCVNLCKVTLPDHEMLIHPSAFEGCSYHPPVEYTRPRKLTVCPLCGKKIDWVGFNKYCKSCDISVPHKFP